MSALGYLVVGHDDSETPTWAHGSPFFDRPMDDAKKRAEEECERAQTEFPDDIYTVEPIGGCD